LQVFDAKTTILIRHEIKKIISKGQTLNQAPHTSYNKHTTTHKKHPYGFVDVFCSVVAAVRASGVQWAERHQFGHEPNKLVERVASRIRPGLHRRTLFVPVHYSRGHGLQQLDVYGHETQANEAPVNLLLYGGFGDRR